MTPTLLAALLVAAAPMSVEDNAGVNAVYDRMSAAYAQRDRAALATVFHQQMVTSSADADQPPVIGGKTMIDLVGGGLDRLLQSGRQAELRFRVTHRSWAGDTAIDLGVLRIRFSGGERQGRTVYSRFLSTIVKGEDGLWRFVSDAPSQAVEADWTKAVPFLNAKFED